MAGKKKHHGSIWVWLLILGLVLFWLYHHPEVIPGKEALQNGITNAVDHLPDGVRDFADTVESGAHSLAKQGKEWWQSLTQPEPELPDRPEETAGLLSVQSFALGNAEAHLICVDGQTLLVDAGDSLHADELIRQIKDCGIDRLSAVVLTYLDENHSGGMQKIVEAFDPQTCYLSKQSYDAGGFARIQSSIASGHTRMVFVSAGDDTSLGGARLVFFGPEIESGLTGAQASVVFRLTYQDKSFLFMGGAGSEAESAMLRSMAEIRSDVLKIGDYRSGETCGEAFLQAVAPKYTIICSENVHEMDEAVKTRLDNVGTVQMYTQNGSVIFTVDEQNLSVQVLSSPDFP